MDVSALIAGNFYNGEIAKADDVVEIVGEGELSELERDGKKKSIFNLPVKVNGKDYIYSPNKTALKIFVEAWTTETTQWVGKKFQPKLLTTLIAGQEKIVIKPQPL